MWVGGLVPSKVLLVCFVDWEGFINLIQIILKALCITNSNLQNAFFLF